jgi:hypothetical protein
LDNGRVLEHGPALKVIRRYLEGRTSGTAVWERPQDEIDPRKAVQILRVAVINDQGKLAPVIGFDAQARIEIESIFHNNLEGITFLIIINNAMGSPVFASTEQDANADKSLDYLAGRFKTECLLPTGVLTPGPYTVTVGVNRENIERLDRLEDIVRFEVSEVNNPGANGRPGAISPRLEWRKIAC